MHGNDHKSAARYHCKTNRTDTNKSEVLPVCKKIDRVGGTTSPLHRLADQGDAPTRRARGAGNRCNEARIALSKRNWTATSIQRDCGGNTSRKIQRYPYMGTRSHLPQCGRPWTNSRSDGRGHIVGNTHLRTKVLEQPEREIPTDDPRLAGETRERQPRRKRTPRFAYAMRDGVFTSVVLDIFGIVKQGAIVDWYKNIDVKRRIMNMIDDYLYDVVKKEKGIELSDEEMKLVIADVLALAENNYEIFS